MSLSFHPLTADRFSHLEALFGKNGACMGCWCMWFRLKRSDWEQRRGEPNRHALRAIVASGVIPGILAYNGTQPVGWVAVQPRSEYYALERSRALPPLDDQPVWSVTCFFVAREWRRKQLMRAMLQAAVSHVRQQGGKLLEGYPVAPPKKHTPDFAVFHGTTSAFVAAGFSEAGRGPTGRPIYRLDLSTVSPVVPSHAPAGSANARQRPAVAKRPARKQIAGKKAAGQKTAQAPTGRATGARKANPKTSAKKSAAAKSPGKKTSKASGQKSRGKSAAAVVRGKK